MKTVLFIDNSVCANLEQLKQYFMESLSPNSPIYEELLTLYRDGILTKWLSEGITKDEKILFDKLNNIPTGLSNSELMEKLVSVFTQKNVQFETQGLSNYIDINQILLSVAKQNKKIELGLITIEEAEVNNCYVRVEMKVKMVDNEKFSLKVFDKESKLCSKGEFSLSNRSVGEMFIIDIPLPAITKGVHQLLLLSGANIVFSFSILVTINESFIVKGVHFKMINIDGDFCEWIDNRLQDFKIGETPVTQALWTAVMEDNPSYYQEKTIPKSKGFWGKLKKMFTSYDSHPVEMINFNDCISFIRKLNDLTGRQFRLPTEDEWLFAAYGGNPHYPYVYSGSDNLDEVGWYEKNSFNHTHSVKEKKPNRLGLYDMSGNVKEWCEKGKRGRFGYGTLGGAFNDPSYSCYIKCRDYNSPDFCSRYIGFRLAL